MSPRGLAALVGFSCLMSLLMIPIPWGDSTGAVFGPISLLCDHDQDFDEFPFLYEQRPLGPLVPAAIRTVHPSPDGDRLMSFTGLGVKLAGVPAVAALVTPWFDTATETRILRANQLTVIWTCLAILGFTLATLRRTTGDLRLASAATAALFFGTTLWPQLRQTLWSNQASLVGIAAATYLAFRARDEGLGRGTALGLGAAVGWAVLARPAAVVLLVPLLVAVLWEHRERAAPAAGWIVLAGIPFAALLAVDNAAHTGSPLRFTFLQVASDIGERMGREAGAFSGNPITGLAGLLVSPSRGLLVFSPFVALALPGIVASVRRRDPLRIALLVGVVAVLALNAGYVDWWGASCWGPRRLMELLPAIVILGVEPSWKDGRPVWLKRLAPPLVAWSIGVQALGFFAYDSRWDAANEPTAQMVSTPEGLRYDVESSVKRMWSVRDGVLVDAIRRLPEQGPAFGLEAEFTLAVGEVVPAPIPPCRVLSTVDRYPPAP